MFSLLFSCLVYKRKSCLFCPSKLPYVESTESDQARMSKAVRPESSSREFHHPFETSLRIVAETRLRPPNPARTCLNTYYRNDTYAEYSRHIFGRISCHPRHCDTHGSRSWRRRTPRARHSRVRLPHRECKGFLPSRKALRFRFRRG